MHIFSLIFALKLYILHECTNAFTFPMKKMNSHHSKYFSHIKQCCPSLYHFPPHPNLCFKQMQNYKFFIQVKLKKYIFITCQISDMTYLSSHSCEAKRTHINWRQLNNIFSSRSSYVPFAISAWILNPRKLTWSQCSWLQAGNGSKSSRGAEKQRWNVALWDQATNISDSKLIQCLSKTDHSNTSTTKHTPSIRKKLVESYLNMFGQRNTKVIQSTFPENVASQFSVVFTPQFILQMTFKLVTDPNTSSPATAQTTFFSESLQKLITAVSTCRDLEVWYYVCIGLPNETNQGSEEEKISLQDHRHVKKAKSIILGVRGSQPYCL